MTDEQYREAIALRVLEILGDFGATSAALIRYESLWYAEKVGD